MRRFERSRGERKGWGGRGKMNLGSVFGAGRGVGFVGVIFLRGIVVIVRCRVTRI